VKDRGRQAWLAIYTTLFVTSESIMILLAPSPSLFDNFAYGLLATLVSLVLFAFVFMIHSSMDITFLRGLMAVFVFPLIFTVLITPSMEMSVGLTVTFLATTVFEFASLILAWRIGKFFRA